MSLISIRWDSRAVKELSRTPKPDQARIVKAVESLCASPLKGEMLSAEWKGVRRLHVGVYRVIYAFDGKALLVSVVRVGHRREVYRK